MFERYVITAVMVVTYVVGPTPASAVAIATHVASVASAAAPVVEYAEMHENQAPTPTLLSERLYAVMAYVFVSLSRYVYSAAVSVTFSLPGCEASSRPYAGATIEP